MVDGPVPEQPGFCSCRPSCARWRRVDDARKTEERLAKMWLKAAAELAEARAAWWDHITDDIGEIEEAA